MVYSSLYMSTKKFLQNHVLHYKKKLLSILLLPFIFQFHFILNTFFLHVHSTFLCVFQNQFSYLQPNGAPLPYMRVDVPLRMLFVMHLRNNNRGDRKVFLREQSGAFLTLCWCEKNKANRRDPQLCFFFFNFNFKTQPSFLKFR